MAAPRTLLTMIERWPLLEPFRITGHTFEVLEVLLVVIEQDGHVGRGEAAGVYYRRETPPAMQVAVETQRKAVEEGLTRDELLLRLPAGGARNALDCALWELEAKMRGTPVWQLAQVPRVTPVVTYLTCGADVPERMAAVALGYRDAPAIKLKLTGEAIDADRVRAVRAVRPDVALSVDANQGFDRRSLARLMPVLGEERVTLIEQPFPVGHEDWLEGFKSLIPIAADESAQVSADVKTLVGRVDVVNIKLDKAGGLTEALSMARTARSLGLKTWVGNMIGTSLAMAPALVLAQICDYVELDGPLFLSNDRPHPVWYQRGLIGHPPRLWGNPDTGQ